MRSAPPCGLGEIDMRRERGGVSGSRAAAASRQLARSPVERRGPRAERRQGAIAQAEAGIAVGGVGEEASATGPGPATGNSEPRLITPALPKEAARRHSPGSRTATLRPRTLRVQRAGEADDTARRSRRRRCQGACDGSRAARPGENGPAAARLAARRRGPGGRRSGCDAARPDLHRAEEGVGLKDRGLVTVDRRRPTRDDRDR